MPHDRPDKDEAPPQSLDTDPSHRRTGHHSYMPRRRLNDDESPRFCRSHEVGGTQWPKNRALERNRRGVCGAEGCNFKIDRRGRVRQISGSHVEDVLRAHREVSREAGGRPSGPWLSGSFYLVAVLAITAATISTSRLAPAWAVPVVIVGSLLGVGTVGALQLRHDDRLSERRFVDLIKLTFLNLPALLRRSSPPVDPLPNDQGTPNSQEAPPA